VSLWALDEQPAKGSRTSPAPQGPRAGASDRGNPPTDRPSRRFPPHVASAAPVRYLRHLPVLLSPLQYVLGVAASAEVLVLGAGGHALVCIEVLRSAGYPVTTCLARTPRSAAALERLGVQVVGRDDQLSDYVPRRYSSVFVAIGNNSARGARIRDVRSLGGSLPAAVSPDAHMSVSAEIGPGALVMPGAVVNALAVVGAGAIVNTGALIDHECHIGDLAHVAPGAALAGSVAVGEGALVGIGARIAPGRRIGAWATVGAGAVVIDDVPRGDTVVGIPARPFQRR
jgi:UDP-perosamine 4-acetyltransferase